MSLRRVLWRLLWPALVVLPLWLLLGRAFFGAPLGLQFLGQLLLVPLLVVVTAVATVLVVVRRSARRARAVSWLDAAALATSWVGLLGAGAFLVDGTADGPSASALTRIAGEQATSLSTVLFAVSVVLAVVGVGGFLLGAAWQLVREARSRLRESLADLEALSRDTRDATASGGGSATRTPRGPFPPASGPVITVTPRGEGRERS